jgi:hypothetical protein
VSGVGMKFENSVNLNRKKERTIYIGVALFFMCAFLFFVNLVQQPRDLEKANADRRVFRKLDASPKLVKPKDVNRFRKLGRDYFVAQLKGSGAQIAAELPQKEDLGFPYLSLPIHNNEFKNLLSQSQ